MYKSIIFIALLSLFILRNEKLFSQVNLSADEIKSLMKKTADWQINNPGNYDPLNWHYGAFYIGLMEMYKTTGGKKYFKQMYDFGEEVKWGTMNDIYHADRLTVSQMYFELYKIKPKEKMLQRTKWVLDAHLDRRPPPDIRFEGNPYCHEWWTWCDALYMAPPAFVHMWKVSGDKRYLDYAIEKWNLTFNYLYDTTENLIFRDDRYFNERTPYGDKVFWSRGNGWVFAGFANMLKILPADLKERGQFEDWFKEMAERLMEIQGEDGLWRSSLLDIKTIPQPEVSGSSFFCYGLAWGINNGLLSAEKYKSATLKAFNGIIAQINEHGRLGYVQPVGKDPKPFTEDSYAEYGTGAFLLAACEILKLL